MTQPNKADTNISIQAIQQHLLDNQTFIQQLKSKLTFSSLQVQSKINQNYQKQLQSQKSISNSLKIIKKSQIDFIISEISDLLSNLIAQKLQLQINSLIEQNNSILLEIKQNLLQQQKSTLKQNKMILSEEQKGQMSFSDVHKLIAQQKKRFQLDNIPDADLQKSLSCLVDFKFESIEEKVILVDKRLKSMEDKYQTNLKSIWNVLSMTQGAVFDFINKQKQKQKEKQKQKKQSPQSSTNQSQSIQKNQKTDKKSSIFKLW